MVSTNDDELLKQLAVVMTANPRGTIKDIAQTAGISKATLQRLYGTRDNLEKKLNDKVKDTLEYIIEISEKEFPDYIAGLKELIKIHFENREYLIYSCSIQSIMEAQYLEPYLKKLDLYFLKGQKEGVFKIDIGVSALTELFVAVICGMIDAVQRGRVAVSGIVEVTEKFFLSGAFNISILISHDIDQNLTRKDNTDI